MADSLNQKANVEHAASVDDTPPAYPDGPQPAEAEPFRTSATVQGARKRGLQVPIVIANLSAEQRQALELRLRRKIDLRLLPTIIIMYIMNYIDR
jgi:hypothetical protein